jgi:hypothetical protein
MGGTQQAGVLAAHLAFKVDGSGACEEALVVRLLHRRRGVGTHHGGSSSGRTARTGGQSVCRRSRLGSRVCSAPSDVAAAI